MMLQRRSKREEREKAGGGYGDKWHSAWLFQYYKLGRNNSLRPLEEALVGVGHPPLEAVAARMGWLTWADLFKCTMRAALATRR